MSLSYSTFDSRWTALSNRDPGAEGHFIYCVTSTHICCRPTCSARLPLKKNVSFCKNVAEAIQQGFVPCKRCKPEKASGWNRTREVVAKACVQIAKAARAKTPMDVGRIASGLGVSKWHFCRAFKTYVELTPRLFYIKCLEGENPLLARPLPAVETRKNAQRKRPKVLQRPIAEEGNLILNNDHALLLSSLPLTGDIEQENSDTVVDFPATAIENDFMPWCELGDEFMPWYEQLLLQDV